MRISEPISAFQSKVTEVLLDHFCLVVDWQGQKGNCRRLSLFSSNPTHPRPSFFWNFSFELRMWRVFLSYILTWLLLMKTCGRSGGFLANVALPNDTTWQVVPLFFNFLFNLPWPIYLSSCVRSLILYMKFDLLAMLYAVVQSVCRSKTVCENSFLMGPTSL